MMILNKKNIEKNYLSVKIENIGKSPMIKSFDDNNDIKSLIEFLKNLDFDIRSQCSISVFCESKILILRS